MLEAQGSVLTNKYSEGYPGKRYYGGNVVVDEAEELARDRACELFGAEHANVQPHSGANANMAVYLALLEPGDKVMGMRLDQGGHLTHGSPVNFSGRLYDFVAYGVDDERRALDYDEIRDLAVARAAEADRRRRHRVPAHHRLRRRSARSPTRSARCSSSTPRTSPGSIAGGAHPSPVPYADVVTFTTHKTLRGPRGGASCAASEYAAAIDKAVFPGLQGGPLMHVIAAKAVAFREAAQPEFRRLRGRRSSRNAAGARRRRSPAEGFRIVSGGTDNHLMLVDLRPFGVTGKVGPGGARPRRDHLQQERDPERPREAVRHERAAPRHRGGHDRGHGRAARWREIARADRPRCCAPPTTTRVARRRPRPGQPPLLASSRRTPSSPRREPTRGRAAGRS